MAQADQRPLGSGFGKTSTGAEVVAGQDLSGKTALVTGGYSGIGLETVRCLVAQGARVIVPARTPDKAAAALAALGPAVRTAPMDLADLASIRAFAADLAERAQPLDLLIANAGVMACPLARVGPGWESQFGINHMGHFALTRAVLPLLRRAGARVVVLSSAAHRMSGLRWDDLQFERTAYDKWQAYGQSKTANALFANALSRRLQATGGLAFSVHPGAIWTPLQRHLPPDEMIAMGWLAPDGTPSDMAKGLFKTVEQGCATTLWAATAPALNGKPGVYCADCDIAPLFEADRPGGNFSAVDPHACDDADAERLWAASDALLAAA